MAKKKSIDSLRKQARKLLDEAKKLEEEGHKALGKTIADLHGKDKLSLEAVQQAINKHLK